MGASLPSDFGFTVVVHPSDPDCAYVIPVLRGTRWSPDNRLAVHRTRDGGLHWEALNQGLPRPTFNGILRDGFSSDSEPSLGLYFGTTSGDVYASADAGDTWNVVAEHLPRIYSVVAATES